MADPNKDKTVLLGTEMYAFSSSFAMACAEESRAYAALKAQKIPLERIVNAREMVEKCTTKTYGKTVEKCGDEYSAVTKCLGKNRREWSKCGDLRTSLEDCFGKNVL